jgi:predicted phage-related endonuclease
LPNLKFASEAEWLALRDMHIGGSDVAALFNQWLLPDGRTVMLHVYEAPPEGALHLECMSPYKSSFRIWQEKAGRLAPDFEENERIIAGKHLEPALASWAQAVFPDWKLQKVRRYIRHDECEGWGASLDYEAVEKGKPPVEFKNVDYLVFRDQWEGTGEDLVPPLHINLQLQSQIGVTKAEFGWIVACVGGNKLYRVKVPRHEPTQARIREAIDLFWQGVKAGAEPRWLADSDTVTRLATVSDVPEGTPVLDLCDNEAACRDMRRYLRWKRHKDFVEGQLEGMKARVGLLMTDRVKAVGADGITVTWPCYTRAAKMIPARWQDEKVIRGGFTVKLPKVK